MLATALIMAVTLAGTPAGGEPDGVVAHRQAAGRHLDIPARRDDAGTATHAVTGQEFGE